MRPRGLVQGSLAAVLLSACAPGDVARPGLDAYNLDETGLALDGFSPVSYVEDGRAEKGSPAQAVKHRGITYHLASAAQRERFAADPARYEPAFGGWCAYGISLGIRWDPDPQAFEIVDGRLFLFSRNGDADARELWDREEDHPALVARAERYWKSTLEE
jgi:hypothetical protein